jgi:DNA polymerase III subunit gamma/tau
MNINLARKWRSRTFDEMVGQELSVRVLKNSLYLNNYFPVYLFSGQRGCGKTTAARIFAAAVNCERLVEFQTNPREMVIPCLKCTSCNAMIQGKHPDFIEIDAASHTGVDNVRQIIDAAALLPVLGTRKVYLIDEAHMLSKAAFNAFLKILEEPPVSVFFILATTDPQKIIETVTSRCFQVLFKPVKKDLLIGHLTLICKQEKISYQPEGLELLVEHSQGSVRDAINLLEQTRLSHPAVTKEAALQSLGFLDHEQLLLMIDCALNRSAHDLLNCLKTIQIEAFSAAVIWDMCMQIFRNALWIKYTVNPDHCPYVDQLKAIVAPHSVDQCSEYLQLLYDNELLFLKSRSQHQLIEFLLIQMNAQANNIEPKSAFIEPKQSTREASAIPVVRAVAAEQQAVSAAVERVSQWQQFLHAIEQLNDPMLTSIFKQGTLMADAQQPQDVHISFGQHLKFFNELLENTKKLWTPCVQAAFTSQAHLRFSFQIKQETIKAPADVSVISYKEREKSAATSSPVSKKDYNKKNSTSIKEQVVTISDANTWKKANALLSAFPGTITEIKEDSHA